MIGSCSDPPGDVGYLPYDLQRRAGGLVSVLLVRLDDRHGPAEEPFSGGHTQVHAAMALGMTEVVVPVGTVQGQPRFCEIHDPWHTGQVITGGGDVAARHVARRPLMIGHE